MIKKKLMENLDVDIIIDKFAGKKERKVYWFKMKKI